MGFPHDLAGKESACNTEDLGSIPGLGRSPGERKGYPLQYSGLENSMDCIVLGVAKSWTRLSNFHFQNWIRASQVVLVVKHWPASTGDVRDAGSIPGSGRSPRGGQGNPLQYSCLENPHGQRSLVGHSLYRVRHDWINLAHSLINLLVCSRIIKLYTVGQIKLVFMAQDLRVNFTLFKWLHFNRLYK